MKKTLTMLAILLLGACSSPVDDMAEVRQLVYAEFIAEDFKNGDAVGGNVLGVYAFEEDYIAEVVIFHKDQSATFYEYEIEVQNLEIMKKEVLSEQVLEFEETVVVDSISGFGHEALVEKSVIPVIFTSPEGYDIPAFVGRYDLVVDGVVADFSFDPFSTNLPFDLKGFADGGRYLEFFKQDLGRLYDIYDLQNGLAEIELAGIYAKSSFEDGTIFYCLENGISSVFEEIGWKLKDQLFLNPIELNSLEGDAFWALADSYRGDCVKQ